MRVALIDDPWTWTRRSKAGVASSARETQAMQWKTGKLSERLYITDMLSPRRIAEARIIRLQEQHDSYQ
jgi:hypothetical protein